MNHSFNIEIAKQIGVEKAILLEYFTFWIEKNIANNSNIHDGKAYTYNSYEALAILFPYMKLNTIKRCIREMENDGILESRTDLNATAYDKTKWYTLGTHSIVKKITIGEDKNNDRVVEKSLSIMNNNHRQLHTQLHTTVTVDKKRKKEKNSPDDVDEFKKPTFKSQIESKLTEYQNINLEAFREWLDYKNNTYKSIAPITKILNMMSKLTLQQQQEMVDTSIMNQYKGLFLPRQQQTAHQTTKNTLDNFDKFYDEYYGQETEVIDTTTVQVAHQGENNGIA